MPRDIRANCINVGECFPTVKNKKDMRHRTSKHSSGCTTLVNSVEFNGSGEVLDGRRRDLREGLHMGQKDNDYHRRHQTGVIKNSVTIKNSYGYVLLCLFVLSIF